jgi:hypothetical protein
MKNLLISLLILLLSTDIFAAYVAVLETGADGNAREIVSLTDRQYLTNVLREEAVTQLPATQNYTIMTRENIMQMLPPGKAIEDCEGSCLVETGKNIAADYVCQARVGSFGGDLTLSAELYETAGNKLIASFNGQGSDVKDLLALVREKSAEFFGVIKNMTHPVSEPVVAEVNDMAPVPAENVIDEQKTEKPIVEPEASDSVRVLANEAYSELDGKTKLQVGESIPANVGESAENASAENVAKKSGPRRVVLGISAAATVTGVVLAVVGNSKAKDAANAPRFANESEFNKSKDDAKSGQTLRGVGIGLAIAGAVGIGLSFVF